MKMAIEFMRWRSTATIQDAARLAAASGRDNVGIFLDALHLVAIRRKSRRRRGFARGSGYVPQLCDAPARQPADNAACIAEARTERMFPGDGGLCLNELMSVLPRDITISVETPHKGDSALSFTERAEKGMAATRRFLDALGS